MWFLAAGRKKNCVYFCTKLYNFILIKCHPEYFENKWKNNFGGNGNGNERGTRNSSIIILEKYRNVCIVEKKREELILYIYVKG